MVLFKSGTPAPGKKSSLVLPELSCGLVFPVFDTEQPQALSHRVVYLLDGEMRISAGLVWLLPRAMGGFGGILSARAEG